jgi:hypothetical protein
MKGRQRGNCASQEMRSDLPEQLADLSTRLNKKEQFS